MARCYILASMSNILQHQHQSMETTYDMMLNLKDMFGDQNRAAGLVTMKELVSITHVEGTPIRDHILKMIALLNELEIFGAKIDTETQIDFELQAAEGLVVVKKSPSVLVPEKASTSKSKGKKK
ncbi:uncharacterized protein LOC131317313 [Rhododendron vialii]|uniref:uncharacterized protein LOC131317313 n=1 Tax=Rhododendron vialii TaxID=182163 RepID=UPI00265D7828|nr:uncharacterized protein LOC131317313 [Rhododendron vialii]